MKNLTYNVILLREGRGDIPMWLGLTLEELGFVRIASLQPGDTIRVVVAQDETEEECPCGCNGVTNDCCDESYSD